MDRLADQYLVELDDEMARTRVVLALVRSVDMGWSPGFSLQTIGWNANHLASIAGWTAGIVMAREFDMAAEGAEFECNESDPAKILSIFDEGVKSGREALDGASNEKLTESWALKMSGQTLFEMPKGDCIRKWVLNHTIHHRGILSTYLRMRGIEVTPVYDS